MTTKPLKPKRRESKANFATSLPMEADERYSGEVDAFVGRNREALNASIRRSREGIHVGTFSTKSIDDTVAEGHKRYRQTP